MRSAPFVQMAINPVVGAFQPDFAVALVAPARQRRLGHLNARMTIEILRHGDGFDGLLIVVHFAEQEVDPVRPFEPPVAEQFGVVRRDDQRGPAVHRAGQPFDLFLAVEHEIAGVFGGFVQRRLGS